MPNQKILRLIEQLRHGIPEHDYEFIASMYRQMVAPCGDFIASYRDPATGLPLPSYDLWEERRGKSL